MIRTTRLVLLALVALALGGPSPAAADPVPFTGTLDVRFRDTGSSTIDTIFSHTDSGVATLVPRSTGFVVPISSLTIPAGAFQTVVDGTTISNDTIALQLATNFGDCERDGKADAPVTCSMYITSPYTGLAGFGALNGQLAAPNNLVIPLTGVGGPTSVTATYGVSGEGWGAGFANVFARTAVGELGAIRSRIKDYDVTSNGQLATGTLTLASPIRIAAPDETRSPVAMARITLHFVPEPGTLLLLGSGIAGLGVYGLRRRSRTR